MRVVFGSVRIAGESANMISGLRVRAVLLPPAGRLVEGPVVDLVGEIMDGGPTLPRLVRQPAQQGSPRDVVLVLVGLIESALEECHNGPDLVVHAALDRAMSYSACSSCSEGSSVSTP